ARMLDARFVAAAARIGMERQGSAHGRAYRALAGPGAHVERGVARVAVVVAGDAAVELVERIIERELAAQRLLRARLVRRFAAREHHRCRNEHEQSRADETHETSVTGARV